MSYNTNTPNTNEGNYNYNTNTPKKDNRNIIYALLGAALIGSWGYFIYNNNANKEEKIQYVDRIVKDSVDRMQLQNQFDMLSVKADSLSSNNQQLQGSLAEKSNEIQTLKNNIAAILKKKNATNAELQEAKKMIAELNAKIESLVAEVEQLKAENKQLNTANEELNKDKTKLTEEKKELQGSLDKTKEEKAKVEDVASTLHVSGINITAIDLKRGKEKETAKAKKADFFRVSFNVDENYVAPNGTRSLMVSVYYPDGSLSQSSGSFTDRNGQTVNYTNKVDINFEQGKKIPVSFDWKPGDKFQVGDYKIVVYNNGYKIGEGIKNLSKSTFLGL